MWGKVEEEKTQGGFTIHLLAPDTRSILAEPRQSAHVSLHRSLLPISVSRPHSPLFYLGLFPCAPAYALPHMAPSTHSDMLLSLISHGFPEAEPSLSIATLQVEVTWLFAVDIRTSSDTSENLRLFLIVMPASIM